MEPIAPGTEEDVQHVPVVSKKTSEEERLLSLKAYLSKGEYGPIFELTYSNGSQHWYCKVCKCPIMGRVFYHESGRRHSLNMENNQQKFDPRRNLPDKEVPVENSTTITVAPGEPVPPGFEGEVTKVAHIQERLNSFRSSSLLGLEYLLEIQDYDHDKEPSYLCLLCWKKGDPRTVIAHLVSYNHLQGYLQRHFPKTYQALAPYVTRQFKKNWQDTMNKIVEAIETKYGRLLPHPVDAETFQSKKDQIYQMVHSGPHFSEKNGVTFEDLVKKEEITKINTVPVIDNDGPEKPEPQGQVKPPAKKRNPSPPVVKKPKKPKPANVANRRRSLSSVSSISSSELSDFDTKKGNSRNAPPAKSKPPYMRNRQSRSRSPRPRKYRSPSPPRRARRDGDMPWNRPDYGRSRSKDRRSKSEIRDDIREEKMLKFKHLSEAIENDMAKTLKQHKQNPEKHPQYNDEWKIFWNKRYKELQLEGKDASKYDFKPEWIIYWNEKIVELHKIEVKHKIEALRKRLGVVDPTPISFKIGGKTNKRHHAGDTKLVPMAHPDNDHEVIVIDDKDDSMSPRRSHSPWEAESASKSRRLSLDRVSSPDRDVDSSKKSRDRYRRSPSWGRGKKDYRGGRDREYRSRDKSWERDISYHRESRKDPKLDIYKPPRMMRDVTRKPVDYARMAKKSPEIEDSDDVNIVAVLRLLTALEDKLGSLGPKIIDMLATALAMEKKDANSSETLLDNEVNCVLFETVKEKLKGALHAGLVDYNQEKAFKIAIKKIATIIHIAGNRKAEETKNTKPKVDPVKVPGVGTVDKAAIAKQIATALVLQGKTDVTHAELEQLINAVVGMAEASKNSDKPMTTASFLKQLSAPKPAEETQPEVKPVIIEPTPSTSNPEPPTNKDSMEGLSDSDLQTLLQNFKDLSTEEQHGLITYLKKLEAKEPERVEKLRKFVNLGNEEAIKESSSGRISPFMKKLNDSESQNPSADKEFSDFEEEEKSDVEEKREEPKFERIEKFDSDDEEYSFEDVFKAASKNVEENKLVKERQIIEETIKLDSSKNNDADMLTDAKALIANIMGSIASKASPKVDPPVETTVPVSPKPTPPPQTQPQPIINNQPVQNTQPTPKPVVQLNPPAMPALNAPIKTNTIHLNLNPGHSFPSQGGYNGPPRGPAPFNNNQNVQYPIKSQYGAPSYNPNYGNNYNYSNQFKQNNRFHPNRGQFGNVNNRGNGNFNARW